MSSRVRVVAAVAVGLVSLSAASCTEEAGGNPQGSLPTSNIGPPDVPKVVSPLDAAPFLTKPCELVDDAVVTELGGQPPGEPDIDSDLAKKLTGPTCTWRTGHGSFYVGIQTVHSEYASKGLKGIAGIYAGKEDGLVHELQPTEVPGHPGYPGAFAWRNRDKENGLCPLMVGIRDDLTFVASARNDNNPPAACEAATKLAASVLDTLKKGA